MADMRIAQKIDKGVRVYSKFDLDGASQFAWFPYLQGDIKPMDGLYKTSRDGFIHCQQGKFYEVDSDYVLDFCRTNYIFIDEKCRDLIQETIGDILNGLTEI